MGESGRSAHEAGSDAPLRFIRHPNHDARYAALDETRARVERGDEWGEFTRDGQWLSGPLRWCDPMFARWITSERTYQRVRAKTERQDR